MRKYFYVDVARFPNDGGFLYYSLDIFRILSFIGWSRYLYYYYKPYIIVLYLPLVWSVWCKQDVEICLNLLVSIIASLITKTRLWAPI